MSSLLFLLLLYPSFSRSSRQVKVSISAACRGDLSIRLESPGGTASMLLDTRPNDASAAGLRNWTLMTVHSWGEQPRGLWTFQVPLDLHNMHSSCFSFSCVVNCSAGRDERNYISMAALLRIRGWNFLNFIHVPGSCRGSVQPLRPDLWTRIVFEDKAA